MIRMAVCMYGCWRTGDRTLEYIKEFFNLQACGVQVDFFCSVKEYDQYFAYGDNEMSEPRTLTTNERDHIHQKLTEILRPKAIRFLDDLGKEKTQIKLSSIIDSVFLKKKYEVENNIKYDIVFLYRYDIIIDHLEYLKSLMRQWQRNEYTKIILEKDYILKPRDIIFCDVLSAVWQPEHDLHTCVGAEHTWAGITVYQDLLLFGTGNAVDRIIYEFLYIVRQNDSSLRLLDDLEGHYTLAHAIRNAGITQLPLPRLKGMFGDIWIQWFSPENIDLLEYYRGQPLILRPTYEWQDDDNIFSNKTLSRIRERAGR